jgi:hypothetical protein
MKKVGIQNGQLLIWHRTERQHPIFSVKYARENLVSLIESLFMLYMYLVLSVLLLHLSNLYGFLESETLTWLIVESTARNLMLEAPDAIFFDRSYVVFSISVVILAMFIVRVSFNIAKARLHPGAREGVRRHLLKIKALDRRANNLEIKVLAKINQIREEVKLAKAIEGLDKKQV